MMQILLFILLITASGAKIKAEAKTVSSFDDVDAAATFGNGEEGEGEEATIVKRDAGSDFDYDEVATFTRENPLFAKMVDKDFHEYVSPPQPFTYTPSTALDSSFVVLYCTCVLFTIVIVLCACFCIKKTLTKWHIKQREKPCYEMLYIPAEDEEKHRADHQVQIISK